LIAAFRATLEEVQEAALVIQVTDVSNPHHAEQDIHVRKVLEDLGVADRTRLHVLNKIDRLGEEDLRVLSEANGHGTARILTSAASAVGLPDLLARIDQAMEVDPLVRLKLRMPASDGRNLSLVEARGRVLRSEFADGHFFVEAELPQSAARRLQQFVLD
jgi:GTP-binding protein HflX